MSRKLAATFIVAIFLLSTVAILNPVSAHFTLGDLTGTYRYHANDFDPHVPGVIGYVWPGGGQNTWGGSPSVAGVNNAPGYQSPYPGQKPAGAPGANQFGNAPSSSWYQLEGDTYAPFGAVLTGSTGDLIFAINATYGYTCASVVGLQRNACRWGGLEILIPPAFTVPGPEQIVTSFTNDYSGIWVDKIGPYDRYAPGWTVITVWSDAGCSGIGAPPSPACAAGTVYYNHQYIDFTSAGEWYYVRVNGVTAPNVAGRYFFKVLLYGDNDIVGKAAAGETPTQFLPVENWPVMLVKGEIDPAIITGTIRYAGYNQTLYSHPVQEAGRVDAVMTMRLDPYTGIQRPDLPTIDGVAYFNATAAGHYEVEGLAPGIYDLYASAAGYPRTIIETGVTILKGQSLHFDGYLQPGAVIHGNVFTKHQFGDEPWPLNSGPGVDPNTYIKIELYDGLTLNHQPDPSAQMVSWSPLPCVAGGQETYYGRRHAGLCGDPRLGDNIAFPWHEYVPWNGYFAGTGPTSPAYSFYQTSTGKSNGAQFNKLTQDPEGVGPPQHWFVQGGTTTPFHFEFGVKGEYGAPRDLSGMVPQIFATWVNGLTPGRYSVRAWVFRYVQSALDGSTFQEYTFDVTPNEWAGDVTLPIDLRLSSWVNKTVHFHNVINGITEDPIDTGAGFMGGYLLDANGVVYSYNQSALGYFGRYSAGPAKGAWNLPPWPAVHAGPGDQPTTVYSGNDLDKAKLNAHAIETGRANIQFWGYNDTWGGENYGIPSGTYQPYVYVLGYIEQAPQEWVSVTLSGNPTSISDHVYRAAGFNVTVYSIDWERPRVSRDWVWGQWGYGLTTNTVQAPGAIGLCTPFPLLVGNPAAPDTYCSGQQPYPWGAGWNQYKASYPPWNSLGGSGINLGVGQEIDVGFYVNGTLIDFLSDEAQASGPAAALASTIVTDNLYQNDTTSWVEANGGGWNPQYLDPASQTYVPYDGQANHAFFGQELKRVGYIGGYGDGRFVFMKGKNLLARAFFIRPIQQEPTALPGNQQYDLRAFTYGYVQDKAYSVFVQSSQVADNKINLIIGTNVTLDILFKKEHIITPTDGNMSARVRLFDDSGNLVAEWMSSEGTYVTDNGFARAADGTTQYPFGASHPNDPFPLPLNAYNYLPGGVTELHVLMAGLPQVPPDGQESPDGKPKGTYFGDPVVSVTRSQCSFEVNCYKNPGTGWNAPGFFPNSGILGAPDYQGGWTAEVDFVRWYANNTGTDCFQGIGVTPAPLGGLSCPTPTVPSTETYIPALAPVQPSYTPSTPSVTINSPVAMAAFTRPAQQTPSYFPPVNGLLMGESYHIVPGTTATSGISLTEDLALSPAGIGHSVAPNHLGPYSQEGVWQISSAHNSGEASGIFEVDLNGLLTGNALAFTWSNEFRPLSWGLVNVVGAQGGAGWNFYTYDGVYQVYVPPGTYQFTISSPGYATQSWSVAVSAGMNGQGQNLYLEQSNIPVPEFSGLAVAAVSALAASLYVLRRRRK